MILPYSEELNIQYLNRLFDNTSECYKFFWFKAILTKLNEGRTRFSFEELVDEMIASAWYMVSEYHLNLGPNDNLEKVVKLIYGKEHFKTSEKKSELQNSYFMLFSQQEYLAYRMIWKYDKIHEEFVQCSKEHLNNEDIKQRLYREGLSAGDFNEQLEAVIKPVYDSAKNCGFLNWTLQNERI